jgi:outer membrane cobalamin receptor
LHATSTRALPQAAAQIGQTSSAATRVNGERRSASGVETIVVVDGVVWSSGNAMETLDRSSINSIEVIKGAVAAELYGAGAEAGVVVITTNR